MKDIKLRKRNAANKWYFPLVLIKLKSSFKKQNPKIAKDHER